MTLFEKSCQSPEYMAQTIHSTLVNTLYDIATGKAELKNVLVFMSQNEKAAKDMIIANLNKEVE